MIASVIATPVADFVKEGPVEGRVLGSSRAALFIDCGLVVAITGRDVPALPNGVVLAGEMIESAPSPGTPARVSLSRIEAGRFCVELGGARSWSPDVPRGGAHSRDQVGRRGRGLLRNCRVVPATDPGALARSLIVSSGLGMFTDHGARAGLRALLDALKGRDGHRARQAATLLLGRGGGLTPEGDDLLCGALASTAAFATPCTFEGLQRAAFVEGLVPGDLRTRTNSLSATLVELAAGGLVIEPVQHLCDLSQPPGRWRPDLNRLLSFGHSTGRAWALGIGAAALMLAA